MIKLTNITQQYPSSDGKGVVTIMDNVTLNFSKPGINMILGPSGCGKSTLLRMMGGVRPFNVKTPTSGEVSILGAPCVEGHEDVIMVFQKYSNRPDYTVYRNCVFPFELKLHKNKRPAEAVIEKMLRDVGLWEKKDNYPYELSGGQNQRLALARSLILQPKILLMDEPFGALDAQTREGMQDLVIALQKQVNCLVVFVTHDISEALVLGDRVIVLSTQPAKIVGDYDVATIAGSSSRRAWTKTTEAIKLRDAILVDLTKAGKPTDMRVST